MKVYSVYDAKAEAYLPPMFFVSRGVAIRTFGAAASDEKHDFNRFASDYTLFELGDFDEFTGKFTLHSAPVALGNALELRSSGSD